MKGAIVFVLGRQKENEAPLLFNYRFNLLQFQELVDESTKGAQLSQLEEQCYVGLTASTALELGQVRSPTVYATQTFDNLVGLKPSSSLRSGTKVKVLGRVNVLNFDRYFVEVPRENNEVTRDVKKFGEPVMTPVKLFRGLEFTGSPYYYTWINVNDIDIAQGFSCEDEF